MAEILKINEIFFSIQGESTHAGRPCVFVRLSRCNLRCTWCDTEYAFYEGRDRSLDSIMGEVKKYNCRLVEITGGEPMLQKPVLPLMQQLCDAGFEVLLETGGHMDVSAVDPRVQRIIDVKCPSSGEQDKLFRPNLEHLRSGDQLKFVLADRTDYEWAKNIIDTYGLAGNYPLLFSPVYGSLDNRQLADWILEDNLAVRMQLQMHKYIWAPDARGV